LTVLEERAPHRHESLPLPPQMSTRQRAGRLRGLLAVGFAGGLVPSPSALVVLLGGIALGRAWFGVLLVLAYGIGMALALVGTGLLLVRTRDVTERWFAERRQDGRATAGVLAVVRALPVLTAGAVVAVGLGVTAQALTRL
jgi:ABC-type nickel/cobalt efflux system permease component RcnA